MDVVQYSAWKVSTYSHGYNGESFYKNNSVSVLQKAVDYDFIMSNFVGVRVCMRVCGDAELVLTPFYQPFNLLCPVVPLLCAERMAVMKKTSSDT
jgi:hypothetical protein